MKGGSIAAVQASVDRRQRELLCQIATQRAIKARAEALLDELTAQLHEVAPAAYGRMLKKRTDEILRQRTEVSS